MLAGAGFHPILNWRLLPARTRLFRIMVALTGMRLRRALNQKRRERKQKIPLGGGASTITQQVAKNVFLWNGGSITRYIRKVPEVYFTKMIEWCWGKKRILEVYLNVIEMGPGIFGVEAAAQKYFGKSAKNLSRSEAAMIIACLPNPKIFSVSRLADAWHGAIRRYCSRCIILRTMRMCRRLLVIKTNILLLRLSPALSGPHYYH